MWPFGKKKDSSPQPQPQGGWEEHPCDLPQDGLTMTHDRCVWRCWCSRRWQLVERRTDPNGVEYNYWTEIEPGDLLTEDQFAELERFANEGTA